MVPPRRTTGSTDNQAVTPELEGRILAFLNLVTDPAEIAERIRPYVGCTLPLYVAKQILEARDRRRFTSLDQVAAVLGVAPRTLDVIIANAISSRAVTPELEDRILAFLNRVKDPAEIADRIRPYVERALPMYVAKRILKARDRQCFTSLDQVATALGVDPRILEKSITAIFEDLDTTVSDQYPILLFPVRLETRFNENELWVRIYPDQLAIETHESHLTADELAAGRVFRERHNGGAEKEKRLAWQELVRQHGSPRAAWIVRSIAAYDDADAEVSEAAWTRAPVVRVLPDRFLVRVYKDGKFYKQKWGTRFLCPLPVMRSPLIDDGQDDQLFDEASRWVVDFQEALKCGMAVTIQLDSEDLPPRATSVSPDPARSSVTTQLDSEDPPRKTPSFRVIALGVKRSTDETLSQRLLEDLIDNHRYTSGFAFLEHGTPTNNTQQAKSGLSETADDYDLSYDIELAEVESTAGDARGVRSNAHRLGKALGLGMNPIVFQHTEGASDIADSYAQEMQTALWPATGDYFLRYMLANVLSQESRVLSLDNRLSLWKHFREFVRARGPLPAIRIGKLPYGILPVTTLNPAVRYHPSTGPIAGRIEGTVVDPLTGSTVEGARVRIEETGQETLTGPDGRFVLEGVTQARATLLIEMIGHAPVSARVPVGSGSLAISLSMMERFDASLHSVLQALFDRWLAMARDPALVPRIGASGDPDAELLHILSMEPTSTSHRIRPFVDERFVATLLVTLRHRVFGIPPFDAHGKTPNRWVEQWYDGWKTLRSGTVHLLSELGLENAERSALLRILGWGDGQDLPVRLTEDRQYEEDYPNRYLDRLCREDDEDDEDDVPYSASSTLLFRMLRQALTLERDLVADANSLVRPAICRLTGSAVLDFFNQVIGDPDEIVRRISDDPRFGSASPRAYGVRPSLARRILQVRDSLLGKRFESLEQIGNIPGVGPDTLHDIITSFHQDGIQVDFEGLFRDTLDLCTHRLDAWLTSFATKQLAELREKKPTGLYLGAYGWVEGLQWSDSDNEDGGYFHTPTPSLEEEVPAAGGVPDNEGGGYIHAPTLSQAEAGAVLRSAFLTHQTDSNTFCLNLTSDRVRRALRILDGVREGQELGALLGCQFERGLHDREYFLDQYIDDFRAEYPMPMSTDSESGDAVPRTVVNGLALAQAWRELNDNQQSEAEDAPNSETEPGQAQVEEPDLLQLVANSETEPEQALVEELDLLRDALDGVTDVLVTESVFQSLQGNYDRAAAALDAAAGNGRPPEIECVLTPVSGTGLSHRVCLLFDGETTSAPSGSGPRSQAEPRLAAWFGNILGKLSDIGARIRYTAVDDNGSRYSVLNVNDATETQLQALPGIGPVLASRVIERRQYMPIKDLAQIEGFGDKTVEGLRKLATTGPSSVSLAQLGIDALDFLYLSSSPLSGGETELEQRVRRYVRDQGYKIDPGINVEIDPGRCNDFAWGIGDALELAARVLTFLGGSSSLRPGLLCQPEEGDGASYSVESYDDLLPRVQGACGALDNLADTIPGLIQHPEGEKVISALLLEASRFGVQGAIPTAEDADQETLERRIIRVLEQIQKRVETCKGLLKEADRAANPPPPEEGDPPPPDYDQAVKHLVEAMNALFGSEFVVLPTFVPHRRQHLHSALNQDDILGEQDTERIVLWLGQAAQTHPALRRLEDVLMIADAWSGDGLSTSTRALCVAQLPYCADRRWLALSDSERGATDSEREADDRPRNVLSIVALAPSPLDNLDGVAGLLIDQWTELIPSDTATTGVSLQYDQPNAQAPQCLLLAVPKPKREAGEWLDGDLIEIVEDTMDLMRIRAVDLDALQEVGGVFPALFVPADPMQPGWERKLAAPSLDDWMKLMKT